MVSSASPSAVGCKYQIYQHGNLIAEAPNEYDGSIRWNLDELPVGDYKIKIRYSCEEGIYSGMQSDFIDFTIRKFYWPGEETPSYDSYEKGRMRLK